VYYSYVLNHRTITFPNNFSTIFNCNQLYGELILKLQERTYCGPIEPFYRVGVSREEFVLLRAIILSYPAVPSLSSHAQKLLQAESEKYSRMLLRHLQTKLGTTSGATKYAEIIHLIDSVFTTAHMHTTFLGVMGDFLRAKRLPPNIPVRIQPFHATCTAGYRALMEGWELE